MRSESEGKPAREELLECLDSSVGALVPSFVHGLNNRLVGAIGNLDLVKMYSSSTGKASEKLARARDATAELARFVSGLILFKPLDGPCTSGTLKDIVEFTSLACGRSMSLDSTEASVFPDYLPLTDLEFRALLTGMMSWAVTSCEGAGSIFLKSNAAGSTVVFKVSRTRTGPISPSYADSVRGFPSWMSDLARRLDCILSIEDSDEVHGCVSLEIPCRGISNQGS